MGKRNLLLGIGGIFGSLLDMFLTYLVIVLTLTLKSCVGENGDTSRLEIVASIICIVLIFSIVASIITSIRALAGRKVPLVYIIVQQVVHVVIAVALIFSSLNNTDNLFMIIIAALCLLHFIIYVFGLIKQKKNFKIE